MNIKELLNKNTEIADYLIKTNDVETYELYFVHEKLETVRSTNTEQIEVTVYHRHDDKIGNASFGVYVGMDEQDFNKELQGAINNAKAINNQDYQLVKEEVCDKQADSNFSQYALADLASKIANVCFACQRENTKINALEIFLYKTSRHIENSQGVDKKEEGYECMIEAIPTYNGKDLSVELYQQLHFTTFDEQKLRADINEKMDEVENRFIAKEPEEKLNCPVVLRTEELELFVREIARDLNYSSLYNHSNVHNVNDDLQPKATSDLLSVEMVGQIEGSSLSNYFDNEGSDLIDKQIIKDGKVVDLFGSNRFAQYLEKPNTGNLSLIKIEGGRSSEAELMKKPHLEVVSSSGLMVDLNADYIGGEVRLAYYFDGEKQIPITGISISSKMSDALNSLTLSKEINKTNSCQGPNKALFTSFEIL